MIISITRNKSRITCLMLRCDHCGREYKATRAKQRSAEKLHWCSNACVNEETKHGGRLHAKIKQIWRDNHGVEHPMQKPEVRQRQQATCYKRFGVVTPLQLNSVRKLLKRPDVIEKKYATYKRNGSYSKSRLEDMYYEHLCAQHGVDNVERQVRVHKWPIDFYVKSIDTWIQVDGVYWHGLDGQLEEHRKRAALDKRSRIIVYKWETDRRQEQWFAERGMRLIRITDKQVTQMNDVQLLLDASQEYHVTS